MKNELGEIYYNGRIINMNTSTINELEKVYSELKTLQAIEKEKINECLKKIKEV